jgi:hypothetical protein
VIGRTKPAIEAGRARLGRAAPAKRGTNQRPLDELTKDELYELAQAEDIEGRSTMSKDALLRALKARR